MRFTTELSVLGRDGRLGASTDVVVEVAAGVVEAKVGVDDGMAGVVDESAALNQISIHSYLYHNQREDRYHGLTYHLPSPRAWGVRR